MLRNLRKGEKKCRKMSKHRKRGGEKQLLRDSHLSNQSHSRYSKACCLQRKCHSIETVFFFALLVFYFLSKAVFSPGFGLPFLGCLNGKGQAQTEDGKPDKALLSQMEEMYAAVPVRLPETSGSVQKLYQEWLEGMDSMEVWESLHTKYSTEKPTANSLDIKW